MEKHWHALQVWLGVKFAGGLNSGR